MRLIRILKKTFYFLKKKNKANEIRNNMECKKLPIKLKSRPTLIYAEVSTRCNLKCRMCGRAHYKIPDSEQGFMEKENFDKLAALFTQGAQLALFGRGETLLHPDFIYFLGTAKKSGMKVGFNTNGLCLTEEIAKAMVENMQTHITFSCSAGTAQTYKNIHGIEAWDRLWKNIGILNDAKSKYGLHLYNDKNIANRIPVIYLEFVSQLSNIHELPCLLEKAFQNDIKGLLVIDVVAHSQEMEKERMNLTETKPIAEKYYAETLSLHKELVKKYNRDFDLRLPINYSPITKKFITKPEQDTLNNITKRFNNSENEFYKDHFCIEPWKTFYVRFNGTVAPCVITGRSLGDLNKNTAEEIWNGEIYQKFRRRMKSKNKPFECMRCHLFPGPKRYDTKLSDINQYEPL